jgi:hypothetical protein
MQHNRARTEDGVIRPSHRLLRDGPDLVGHMLWSRSYVQLENG